MMSPKSLLPILVFMAASSQAGDHLPLFSAKKQVLPDLALPSDLPASRFAMDGKAATIGGDTSDQTWTTRFTYPSRLDAAMNLDYGLRLDPRLTGGANLVYGTRHKELLLNAIYAPQPDLRLKFSSGQLRQTDDFQFASGPHADSVAQRNYSLDVRKYWDQSALLSDISLTAWRAHANEPDIDQKTVLRTNDEDTLVYLDPRLLAAGVQEGYRLNIGVAPLPQTRLELGTGADRLSYDFADGSVTRNDATSRRVKYTQYLDNCSRLQGSYDSNAYSRSFGLSVANGAWSIGASRTLERDNGDNHYALNAGYTIPMGKTSGRANTCASELKNARSYGSMVHNSATRNPNLPAAPLVQVDPTVKPVLSAIWAKNDGS
jgi:hypothetical protein